MKALLAVAVVAAAGVAGLLLIENRPERTPGGRPAAPADPRGPPPPPEEEAAPLPFIEEQLRGRARRPGVQADIDRFVSLCVARGSEVVPQLLERLRDRPDVLFQPRWVFDERRVKGYPTLRSAYLTALILIEGREAEEALRDVLDLTQSVEETHQIAHGLLGRGARGWETPAIERALQPGAAAQRPTRKSLLEIVAEADPAETSMLLVARAPRGNDATDPTVLSHGLKVLPIDTAMHTGQTLLDDAEVTGKAKKRILRDLCSREETDVFDRLRRSVQRGMWSESLRLDVAYAAANAPAFFIDPIRYSSAKAGGRGPELYQIRERYTRRLQEVERLVAAALAHLPADDARVLSLGRMLAKHRQRLG
ncbi:MAG: hypothetical protein ACYTF8_08060 [Planctomycetota bacterium]|jgi:hypothetical protein